MDIFLFLSIGLAIGLVSGALGIGGGMLLVPALIWVAGLAPSRATGTTLAVLVLPLMLPAAWQYYTRGNIDMRATLYISVAFAIGGYVGAALRSHHLLPEDALRLCFGLIMMYIAVNMIVMSDSETAKAAAGATATAAALVAYVGLRIMGRRALARPKLQEQIQRMNEQGRGNPDYYI